MQRRILNGQQEVVLAEERAVLRSLHTALARHAQTDEDLQTLERSTRRLDDLFLLVVVGEFNSGKSTLINALIGARVLEEGVTPTTTRIHRLRWSEGGERGVDLSGIEEIGAPAEILRHLQIVDTPGTNALDRQHEAVTQQFVPESDLVLFVTSADRPFTESERAFIERIREWGKKLVLVVNKVDFLTADGDVAKVRAFIEDNARQLLGFLPEIFFVSARPALEARLEKGPQATPPKAFAELERWLFETLDDHERVRLKLLNPLGVGLKLAESHLSRAIAQAELLRDDLEALDQIESQLSVYEEDLASDFRFRLTDVDHELQAFEKRGLDFFEETLRLPRVFDLINKERIQADFERKVIGETPKRLEAKVEEIIDWLVDSELEQWQVAGRRIAERQRVSSAAAEMGGEVGRFDYNREELLERVGRSAQETIRSYDEQQEARRMAESVQATVAATGVIEVGAIGLGTVFTLLATTQLMDFTGILAASTIAVLGLMVLPRRRRKAKADLSARVLHLRNQLMEALTQQFQREVERSGQRIRESVAPYSRFVRSEHKRLTAARELLSETRDNLIRLREMIEAI
jgi:small GTP-binding protein